MKYTGIGVQFTDELTGNLDSQNSSEVIALLKETSKKYEQTIIMITHNRGIAQTADRVLQVSVFDRIMGNTKYGLIGIQLDSNATEETIAEIRSLENDDIIITDQRESNKQNNATYLAVRIVCYGFLATVGIISLFNIVNSISMSVSARIKQYGAMRAVGMDNRQLKRMISAEAYTYAISGLIVGCGIGLPLNRFLYNRLITHYFGIEWSFPNLWFGSIVAFIFISAIVSVYAPSKRIRNMSITETINEW